MTLQSALMAAQMQHVEAEALLRARLRKERANAFVRDETLRAKLASAEAEVKLLQSQLAKAQMASDEAQDAVMAERARAEGAEKRIGRVQREADAKLRKHTRDLEARHAVQVRELFRHHEDQVAALRNDGDGSVPQLNDTVVVDI